MKSISPQKAKRTLDYLERRKQGFNRKYDQYYADRKKLDGEIDDVLDNLIISKCPECGCDVYYSLRSYYKKKSSIENIGNELCSDCNTAKQSNEMRIWFAETIGVSLDHIKVKYVDHWKGYIIFQVHGNELKIDLREYYKVKQ
jgi:hypothetical protein